MPDFLNNSGLIYWGQVTEKKETEIYLQNEKIRAEEISKAKSEFIANMSHDIKTPLSGIIGMTDILLSNLKDKKEIDCAKDISRASHTLMNFVESCIGVVLAENSSITFSKEHFFLKSIFQDIFCLFQPAAKSKGLSFTIHYPDNTPDFFSGSRAAIYRILLNLVANAIKFTNKGSIHLQASFSECPSSAKRRIAKFLVEDTGIGISEDEQKIIFDRYTRLSPSYENVYEGTGIGLSIVKRFIEELGGEIHITSQKHKGSRFLVILPLEVPLLQAEEYHTNELATASSISNRDLFVDHSPIQNFSSTDEEKAVQRCARILLVEDDMLAQKIAELILNDLGCDVTIADCGNKAIELFSANKYHLAFIDLACQTYQVTVL